MSLRKYQSVEEVKILPPEDQSKVAENLHKLGKTSAVDLTDEERAKALDSTRVI